MTTAIMPHVAIRPISPSINYGPCFRDFTFLFHFDRDAPMDPEWRTIDVSAFPIPEGGSPYTFSWVVPRGGVVVATGTPVGPVADATIPGEVLIDIAMVELRAVVSAIQGAGQLPLSADLDDLLTRAAGLRGTPANVEEWARQIAADVSDLKD
jgi:hypothetical protein